MIENGISEFRFPESCLPPDFVSEHIRMCEEFTDRQMDTIKCNLDHYPSMSEQYGRWIETVKDACADIYINTYELRPIPINCRMFPFKKVKPIKPSFQSDCLLRLTLFLHTLCKGCLLHMSIIFIIMKIHTKYKAIIYASVKYNLSIFFWIIITEKEETADLDSN